MERTDLVLPVGAHPQPSERPCEQRAQRVRAPTRIAARRAPRVVVLVATDSSDAPVVRRAPPDHPCARQLDRASQRMEIARVVPPLIRRRERARVEQVGRPASGLRRAVVGAGLEHDHAGLALRREPAGDDAPGRSPAEHHHVA